MTDQGRHVDVSRARSHALARRRVLLLTSHPLDARDGADKELSLALASGMPDLEFTWFGRGGAREREPYSGGRRLPLLSRTGMPGPLERAQAAALGLLHEPRVDLVHAVVTIGPRFAQYVRLRERVLGDRRRPAVHTVPAVGDASGLRGTPSLGTTVVLSRATERLLREAGFPDVRLIPPGIDLDRWPLRAREAVQDPPVVAFAGHYDVDGGLWDTVAALGELARQGRRLCALFLMRLRPGQDQVREGARLLQRAREAGLADVRVHGRTRNVPSVLAAVDLLLLPARELGGKADVPLTLLEAMATGRPVVVTDLPEMAALSEAATRVRAGDVTGLAAAVGELLDGPQRWRARATAGRRLVEQRFSAQVMVARYAALYDELLDGGPNLQPSSG